MTSSSATRSHDLDGIPPAAAPRSGPDRLPGSGHPAPPGTAPPVAGVRERLVPPFPAPATHLWRLLGLGPDPAARLARATGWLGPLLVALLAGVLRFWRLGQPRDLVFDETYYAKDAWALLHLGYEGTWPDRKVADPQVLAHPQVIPLSDTGSFVAHPPTGKWVISVGEWLFGLDPVGWRFMTALLGTLSVLMLCRIGRRLFRSTFLGCLAGALLAMDGLHLVMSRTALLDLMVMFFALAAFGCLLLDRDRTRARLAAALPADADGRVRPDADTGDRTVLGLRPWRLAAGVLLGLAASTKWNGLYVLVFFTALTVLWDVGARRVAGARRPYRAVLRRDLGPSVLSLVPTALGTYLLSWTGWFLSDDGWGRHWADGRGGTWSWIPAPLRSLWHYEYLVYQFNVGLHTPHKYQSNPWSWLVMGRPVLFAYDSPKPGQDGCTTAAACTRTVLALGTPALWWAACLALGYLLFRWALRRDWRAGAILCAVAAGYLPWFLYQDRTVFSFYAVVFVPYLCLAVAMMIGALVGPPDATRHRRIRGAMTAGALVVLIAWNFVYFFPIYTGRTIPYTGWQSRMWLDTWI
ncbi:dolichyl-phosphate-mannose--protein mannosyltransferase [Streptomyces sp. NPDC127079]|uniref:dolichyl-phosphate-mannose--protein mannosyltransferase n=1 Tax=Streptomyces sp. NPDC127079 TaxID=3347132 RepID=UPI00364D9839